VTLDNARRHTGLTRALRVLGRVNQSHGFDCPGCAWPDPEERSFAEFCENGAKAVLDEATRLRVGRDFFREHSLAELRERSELWLNAQGRLVEPMVLRPGATHYEPISYADAYELIADELCALEDANQATFYTSGRASNEAAFLYQLLARSLGTNNLPDCSNLCHESSGVALKETLGVGKATVRLEDFLEADLIFVIGQNPGSNHPRMLSTLREARARGATIVSINPLRELGLVRFAHPQHPEELLTGGSPLADEHVPVRVNGDLALFRGINKALLEAEARSGGVLDRRFLADFTTGFSAFAQNVADTPWTEIVERSGIAHASILRLAELVQKSRAIICCWAMGLTQHHNAVATIQEVVSFLLLRGNVGRPGAGACPVRGHSNVQGDRTMGIATQVAPAFHEALERRFGIRSPRAPGLDTVGTIAAMAQGHIRVFLALGGNFLSASPDTEFTARALRRCALTVHVTTKLNRSHLATGRVALLLPCLGRTERDAGGGPPEFVTVENSMGVVHASRGHLDPAHPDLRGEPRLLAELGAVLASRKGRSGANDQAAPGVASSSRATQFPPEAEWRAFESSYATIRQSIAEVIPGFDDFEARAPRGFELPNGARDRIFATASGKAEFKVHPLTSIEPGPGELVLTTVRSHDQFNTTVYTLEDRYRGVSGDRRVVLLSPADLAELGLAPGSTVRIESRHGDQTRVLEGFRALPYEVPRGTAVAYFPEANPLIPLDSIALGSRTPTSKSVRVRITRTLSDP
jgi:molybdopterin-dependent oxidoreductase alpha subunit